MPRPQFTIVAARCNKVVAAVAARGALGVAAAPLAFRLVRGGAAVRNNGGTARAAVWHFLHALARGRRVLGRIVARVDRRRRRCWRLRRGRLRRGRLRRWALVGRGGMARRLARRRGRLARRRGRLARRRGRLARRRGRLARRRGRLASCCNCAGEYRILGACTCKGVSGTHDNQGRPAERATHPPRASSPAPAPPQLRQSTWPRWPAKARRRAPPCAARAPWRLQGRAARAGPGPARWGKAGAVRPRARTQRSTQPPVSRHARTRARSVAGLRATPAVGPARRSRCVARQFVHGPRRSSAHLSAAAAAPA